MKPIPDTLELSYQLKKGKSIAYHIRVGKHERSKNRNAIKSFLCCTHSLCKQHIPHTTNFHKLINLVTTCGGKDLEEFAHRAVKNVSHTSSDAIIVFVETNGVWVDELQVNQLLDAPFFNLG